MFCCVRTRDRKERTFDDQAKVVRPPPAKVPNGYDEKSGKSSGHGLKEGNMTVMAGATGAVVGATVATAVVVAASNDQTNSGDSQGCCCGGGDGGGGCGGCGGCGG